VPPGAGGVGKLLRAGLHARVLRAHDPGARLRARVLDHAQDRDPHHAVGGAPRLSGRLLPRLAPPAHAADPAALRDRSVLPERARAELRLDGAAPAHGTREPLAARLGNHYAAARPHVQRAGRARRHGEHAAAVHDLPGAERAARHPARALPRLGEPGRWRPPDVLARDAAAVLAGCGRRRAPGLHRGARLLHHPRAAGRTEADDDLEPDRVQRATGAQLALRLRARQHAARGDARAVLRLRALARGAPASHRLAVSARLGRVVIAVVGASVLAFLVVPVLSVIPMSFSSSMVFELIPSAPGLVQYRRFFASPEWMIAFGRSVQVALGTTVLATALGTLAALGLARIRSRWRPVLEAALISSRIVPSIVFAVAAYFVFSQVGLVGTIAGLVLAHSVLAFPFVVVLVTSALAGFDRSLEEASRSLGAGPVKTFFRVTFPQIRLAVFGG